MLTGMLPTTSLRFVQGTQRLEVLAAASWKRLVADVRAQEGDTLRISEDGAYRSLARQKVLSGKGNHQYQPGASIHGLGRSVDINNWASVGTVTLDAIANRHGWRRTIPGEPWHYQYSPNLDRMKPTPTTKGTPDVYAQLIQIKKDPNDRQRSVWEKYTPAGTVQLIGYDLAREHNHQTGAPASLDGTSKSAATKKRVALVRQLWAIEQEAYRSLHRPVRLEADIQ